MLFQKGPQGLVERKHWAPFTADLLHNISSNFTISEAVRLRPDYLQGVELKSIVIGYLVDGEVVADMQSVVWHGETQSIAFKTDGREKPHTRVDAFSLLLPLEESDERNLSYDQREALNRMGLFKRGNTLKVISQGSGHLGHAIEGEVTGHMRLEQGVFSNHEVAIIRLDPSTLEEIERRLHPRLATNVEAVVKAVKGEREFTTYLHDYTEEAACFLIDDYRAERVLEVGRRVSIDLNIKELGKRYQLEAVVKKLQDKELVVSFSNILKDGAYTPFTPMDGIEIKALLNKLPQSHLE